MSESTSDPKNAKLLLWSRQLERAKRLGAIIALIFIAAVLAAYNDIPRDYRTIVAVFLLVLVLGWVLMLFLLYRSPTESSK
jgi:peptidoglycan/LPS O-acetylase OafA/YrhL